MRNAKTERSDGGTLYRVVRYYHVSCVMSIQTEYTEGSEKRPQTVSEARMDLSGKTVSHYKVLRRLGAGGMGVVYMARDLRLDRLLALKFVAPRLDIDDSAPDRLKAEARAASSLDHPNIGTVYEIDDAPEVGLFIAMAYYPGVTLAERLSEGSLPMGSAVDFATQIADGLAYAHDHGVVHGDIKPGNLIITGAGVVKILDFGLARSVGAELTQTGVLVGTPAFMSPERIAGRPRDAGSDIWSLGIVMYNMLTGELPFSGNSVLSIMQQIEVFNPEFRSVPEDVRPVLLRALARTPATRYRRMRDLLADLRAMAPYHANWVQMLPVAQASDEAATVAATPSSGEISPLSELRQISVLSCELCSYDEIAAKLDPEQLRDLLVAFQQRCEEIARRFDGHIDHLADAEIRINFGYPVSHEDDAYRGVCAALAIQGQARDLLQQLGRKSALPTIPGARVGIHTGPMLTEKMPTPGRRSSAVGITSVIATKAQKAADPGTVLISANTLALVQQLFEARQHTEIRVSGKIYLLYAVLNEVKDEHRRDSSSFEITPLVSRERELEVLSECWQSACSGSGRVVFLMGEAGIGKSRLIRTFKERLSSQPHRVLHCRCSQLRRNSPLSPIIDLLAQASGLDSSLSPSVQASRVHETLERYKIRSPADREAIVSLLSIPAPETDVPPTTPMSLHRDRTLALVAHLILASSADQPLVLVVEDLHWADPSTLDFLGLVIDQGPASAVLMILTFRPDFAPPWHRSHVKLLSLDRLNSQQTKHMIELLLKDRRLPKSILERLMSNSDGVPLFIEELTKAVLASIIDKVADFSSETQSLPTNAVPSTLRDSLMARLDRLGNAKHVAQVASVLGRTFPYRWLEALCPMGEQYLSEGLQRLVEAELLYRRGIPPDEHYTFKHALIRDSAYESLLPASRKHYHSQIAHYLEEHFEAVADAQPELVAHHYTEANEYREAIPYWRRAGHKARRRSASVEASAHFSCALQLIRFLPDSVERKRSELTLWVSLGSSQLAISGYGADSVRRAFETARSLCTDVGENRELFDALQGLWAYYVVHADLNQSLSIASSLDMLSATLDDARLKLEASLRHGISHAMLGELTSAREHFERVEHDNQIFDRGHSAITYGQDPVVACLCHLSLVQWLLGYSKSAVMTNMKAVKLASELAHPFTLSWAYLYAAIIHSLRGEPKRTLEFSEQLKTVCEEQEFAYRLAQSRILGAWARSQESPDGEAIEDMQRGIDMVQATGARVFRPYYLGMLAQACLRGGQLEKGQLCAQLGLETVKETGERFFEAELHRLNAEFLHKLQPERVEDSTQSLIRALSIAKSQKARALQLKAAISLVDIAPQSPEAMDAIEEALSSLPESQETPDVDRARLLLARL